MWTERLDAPSKPAPNAVEGERWLHHWQDSVFTDDAEGLARRLRFDNLAKDAVRDRLGTPASDGTLPAWAATLERVTRAVAKATTGPELPASQQPLPFVELLGPMLAVARELLAAKLDLDLEPGHRLPGMPWLSQRAWTGLERELLKRLVALTGRSFEQVFRRTTEPGSNLLAQLLPHDSLPLRRRDRYKAFVQQCLNDGLRAVFWEFPVLARLSMCLIDGWVEGVYRFVEALHRDAPEVARVLLCDGDDDTATAGLGHTPRKRVVVRVDSELSDPHGGGQTVKVIHFDTGEQVVYKPRSVALAGWFHQVVGWYNAVCSGPKLKALRVLDRGSHGWMEWAGPSPCHNRRQVEQFYERAGALLCLLYVLGGNDTHFENLVAVGEHPVAIDLETLLQPLPVSFDDRRAAAASATAAFADSVLRTGMLPRWSVTVHPSGTVAFDDSALGAGNAFRVPYQCWRGVGTDGIHWVNESRPPQCRGNLPVLGDGVVSSLDYTEHVVRGFSRTYRQLASDRDHVRNVLLPTCRSLPVRFIFRGTAFYFMLRRYVQAPEFLTCGIAFSLQLDTLSRAFVVVERKPQSWPIVEAEHAALQRLDIPCFRTTTDGVDATDGAGRVIANCFVRSGYDRVCERLQRLGPDDLQQQQAMITGSFVASQPVSVTQSAAFIELAGDDKRATPVLTDEALLATAEWVGDRLLDTAVRSHDGSLCWLGLRFLPQAERFQLQPMGANLYDGNGGIAIFLAALARVTGNSVYEDAARRSIGLVTELLQEAVENPQAAQGLGIGGAIGVGSLVYSVVRTADLLQDQELLGFALPSVEVISEAWIGADRSFDVLVGCAGTALALLRLHALTGDAQSLATARLCGQHLLANRVVVGPQRMWLTLDQKPMTGYSHGAAGLSYALAELYGATAQLQFLEAAREAIAFETACLQPERHNWSRHRPSDAPDQHFGHSWCHGAPGIGLARLGVLQVLSDPAIVEDIETSIAYLRGPQPRVDQVCCGNAGRLETLLVAADRLGRAELRDRARELATSMVDRQQHSGDFTYRSDRFAFWSPAFFRGAAGIGYQLLRVIDPHLPSVLLWE